MKMRRREYGFSAVELTAVASIIAILALILVPIVRNRLEQVRRTAALDDMRSIEVAQVLANADTGRYYPLQYLDNASIDLTLYNDPSTPQADRDLAARSIPNAAWNAPLPSAVVATGTQLGSLGSTWQGPYITYNQGKFIQLGAGQGAGDPRFHEYDLSSLTAITPAAQAGPAVIFRDTSSPNADPYNDDPTNLETYPIDPWGSPYLFFGPGRYGPQVGANALSNSSYTESNFGTAIIYSTGTNGIPGDDFTNAGNALSYFREPGALGVGDDLWRIF